MEIKEVGNKRVDAPEEQAAVVQLQEWVRGNTQTVRNILQAVSLLEKPSLLTPGQPDSILPFCEESSYIKTQEGFMKLDILYLDNHLIVVNKNPGLLAQKDKTGDSDLLTLAKDFLKKKFNKPGNVYLGLVHRLDRPASGLMALARTTKAASRLSSQFRNNTPEKRYIALVEGNCSGQGICKDYILKENQKVRIVDSSLPKAQYAELAWESVAKRDDMSLLKIVLKSGRPHQIRIQLEHIGFPVLGDLRYGAKREFDGKNLALHCWLLGLEHPVKNELMKWVAKPPSTWNGRFDGEIKNIIKSA